MHCTFLNSKNMNWQFMDYNQDTSTIFIANHIVLCNVKKMHAFSYNFFWTWWKDHEDID